MLKNNVQRARGKAEAKQKRFFFFNITVLCKSVVLTFLSNDTRHRFLSSQHTTLLSKSPLHFVSFFFCCFFFLSREEARLLWTPVSTLSLK